MDQLFNFMIIAGLLYAGTLIFIRSYANKKQFSFKKQVLSRIGHQLKSDKLQSLMQDAGIQLNAQMINIIRYSAACSYIIFSFTIHLFREGDFQVNIFVYALLFLFITSTWPFSPTGFLLRFLHKRRLVKKDSEVIAFLKLYQNSKRNDRIYMQFWSFCAQVAPYFQYIQQELYHMSERIHEDDIEKSLDWLVSRFPEDHEYIHEIRSIILTAENNHDEAAVVAYLDSQNKVISDMTREQYSKRWSYIADIATIINVVPSVATFLMIIFLVLYYLTIVKNEGFGF